MLFLSGIISLGLSLLLASAQQTRCPSNEVWSYPVDGCNTCLPEPFCETRQEFGCNCRSGYTREIFTGFCISRALCPLAPATVSTITSTNSTRENQN
ncbi:hypothetical protein HNY73_017006 [Argiope bruennichi]|uniref:TIL domain-containing protein n=1 Tax=Argiope bruennichi TaxID=94029 RepID=A0A8T0EKN2_ARGBR|nr:hypothetical protein HNY73_017006 [Argiope bruennichi]